MLFNLLDYLALQFVVWDIDLTHSKRYSDVRIKSSIQKEDGDITTGSEVRTQGNTSITNLIHFTKTPKHPINHHPTTYNLNLHITNIGLKNIK